MLNVFLYWAPVLKEKPDTLEKFWNRTLLNSSELYLTFEMSFNRPKIYFPFTPKANPFFSKPVPKKTSDKPPLPS